MFHLLRLDKKKNLQSKIEKWKDCDFEFAKKHLDTTRYRIVVDDGHQWSYGMWESASKCLFIQDALYEFQTTSDLK